MKSLPIFLTLAVGLLGDFMPLRAQTVSREGAMEKLPLFAPGTQAWSAAESTCEPSVARVKVGESSWRWHVAVDYYAGEPKYPVGWPRLGHAIPAGPMRDWSAWDFLHGWIYVETSRAGLPAEPAGLALQGSDRANAYTRVLGDLKKDRWVELNIPLSQIRVAADVRQIQLHVAEANYRHGDQVDFYLNDLALVRYAEPTVFGLVAENTVLFADARHVPVRFELLGVKPQERVRVGCELRSEGITIARTSDELSRGTHRLVLDLGGRPLAAGAYEVRVAIDGRAKATAAQLRVVDSPWQ